MRRLVLTLLLLCATSQAHAQSLVGTWQGSVGQLRNVVTITKSKNGSFRGDMYILDIGDAGLHRVSPITLDGKTIKIPLDDFQTTFDGTLSDDGKSIAGVWRTGGQPDQNETFERVSGRDAASFDTTPHKAQFVTVDAGVQLEVLDWGGKGRSMVFLSGLGNSAHVFDSFAPKFADKFHVIGISRRGFGASSTPPPTNENYDADRLGDDVLKVIDALHLDRPVLVGHSIAGQELSSIGTRHPEKVSGLVYLDAAMVYAFYDPSKTVGTYNIDVALLRKQLAEVDVAPPSRVTELLEDVKSTLGHLEKSVQYRQDVLKDIQFPPVSNRTNRDDILAAIWANPHAFTDIRAPALVISAIPPGCGEKCTPRERLLAQSLEDQVSAVEHGMKTAHVVRILNANHYVFYSNEADVLREMNAFLGGLK